jgi:hypothetical protein
MGNKKKLGRKSSSLAHRIREHGKDLNFYSISYGKHVLLNF